jgi:drug/metabolite transporter (DMT)-like permease
MTLAWKNILKPTPKRVAKLIIAIKGVIVVAAGSAYVSEKQEIASFLLVIGAILDGLSMLIGEEDGNVNTGN